MIPTQFPSNVVANDFEQLTKFKDLVNIYPLSPFSKDIIDFTSNLSSNLLKTARQFPDVMTFAFWCRKGSLQKMAEKQDISQRKGRGLVFHITPSNIPVNFAFSTITGLLTGNANIVRIPSKKFKEVDVILNSIDQILQQEKFFKLRPYLNFVTYNRDEQLTNFFSQLCDVRIIWGGDRSISEIRKSALKASAFDVVFSDRYSASIVNAKKYLDLDDKGPLATQFYNDTYLFDQNACTSPKTIFWYGNKKDVENAKKTFWNQIQDLCAREYNLQALQAMNKLIAEHKIAIQTEGAKKIPTSDNLVNRVELNTPVTGLENIDINSGIFTEYRLESLSDIFKFTSRKYQTLSYFGFEKDQLTQLVEDNHFYGIDRIVPIGKTMDFSLNWDGYELGRALTKKIEII